MAPPGHSFNKKRLCFYLLSIGFTLYLLVVSSHLTDGFSDLPAPKSELPHSTIYRGRHAIGTFLASKLNEKQDSDDEDPYYVSARTLVYQLLHAPNTKLQESVPVVILVTQEVRESKRQRLRDDGAVVIEVEHLAHNMTITVERWIETVTKLRLFDPNVVPYEKVLLIDTDMVLTRRIDAIFQDPAAELRQTNRSTHSGSEIPVLPDEFIMAASPESLRRDHPYPFLDPEHKKSYFNSGLLMYSPSSELFQYYMKLINQPSLYYTGAPDQDLLNYAHRWGGPMPWRRLHYSWYLNWPNDNDLKGNMSLLHTKWWDRAYSYSSNAVEKFALARRWEMEGYWIGKEPPKDRLASVEPNSSEYLWIGLFAFVDYMAHESVAEATDWKLWARTDVPPVQCSFLLLGHLNNWYSLSEVVDISFPNCSEPSLKYMYYICEMRTDSTSKFDLNWGANKSLLMFSVFNDIFEGWLSEYVKYPGGTKRKNHFSQDQTAPKTDYSCLIVAQQEEINILLHSPYAAAQDVDACLV